jgi:hypothetical protein
VGGYRLAQAVNVACRATCQPCRVAKMHTRLAANAVVFSEFCLISSMAQQLFLLDYMSARDRVDPTG